MILGWFFSPEHETAWSSFPHHLIKLTNVDDIEWEKQRCRSVYEGCCDLGHSHHHLADDWIAGCHLTFLLLGPGICVKILLALLTFLIQNLPYRRTLFTFEFARYHNSSERLRLEKGSFLTDVDVFFRALILVSCSQMFCNCQCCELI